MANVEEKFYEAIMNLLDNNRSSNNSIFTWVKQYNISSKELFTEYTLTIKQHKSHVKLQTKIS
jgi:hypothetical protein